MKYLSWSGAHLPSPRPKFSRPYLKSCLCLKGSEQGQIGWWPTVAWHHSLVALISLGISELRATLTLAAICSPPPPRLVLTKNYARTEGVTWQLSWLPCQTSRETDKNTIKSSRYVYAFSFPHYNRFRRITCKNFCTVVQSYNFLFLLIIINIIVSSSKLIKLVAATFQTKFKF